ncbi:MAG: extracellular solute-binding protein [Chloroflexia bacterium]|nr:extracellular solute-binding protein [Chloroflexia bacterium]
MVKQFNRRSIVKGAAGAGAGLASVGALGAASSTFAAPAVIQDGPLEITYWTAFGGGVNGEAQTAMIERFHESQPDIMIVPQALEDYEAVAAQLITGLQTGDSPDIATLSDVWWFRFYLAQALEDLTPLLADYSPEDYVQSLYNDYQRAGGQYAVPFARSTPLFYFNVDALEAAGLSEDIFETWSSFREAAPDLIAGSGLETAMLFGSAASYGAWTLQGPTWAFEGAYSDPEFNILLEEEGTVNCGEFMREFIQSGNALAVADPGPDFNTGVSVAAMQSTGSLGTTRDTATFNFKTAFIPEELVFGCCTGGTGISMIAGLEDTRKQAAMAFLDFSTNTEQTTIWSQTTGYMPVRISAIESEEEQAFLDENPNARTAVEQLPLTEPQDSARVFIPNGDQILGRGWEQILVQNRPAPEVWAEVTAELEPEAAAVLEQLSAIEG